MDLKGAARPGTHHYFVTLASRGRQGLFERHPAIKTAIEEAWPRVMRRHPHLDAEQYTVNGHRLHALVQVQPADSSEASLRAATATYLTETQATWQQHRAQARIHRPAQLWEDPQIRPIRDPDELQRLREFIVQKMLGTELSALDDEAEEEGPWY